MNRRSLLGSTVLGVAALLKWPRSIGAALADDDNWRHGVSLFGDLKYPAGFTHFDYVNADAPKGGTAREAASGTFDNFNGVVARVKGSLAAGIDLINETLLISSLDEISTGYGLLAEAVSFSADFSSVTYRLREQAKWHDGTLVTPDDVIFSFEAFKKYSPELSAYYRHVSKAEKTGDREVTFAADTSGNRELPRIIGELTVLPKRWWEGADPNGKKRNIGETTLEPPLGSGPYRIKDFSAGRHIVYERVKDHWSSGLNVNVGLNNFDELHYEYFRDTTAALEAFKAGIVDWRIENSAKNWATAYDFPAVSDKRVLLEEFAIRNVGIMQAFAFNIRREKFQDPLVRLAFNYAFNFEEMNKQIFFDQYKRIASYFAGTELAATGLPAGRELELLDAVRDKVPPEVFTKSYTNPVSGNPEAIRNNQREAMRLLKQAGYEVRDQQLVKAKTGEPYAIEFLAEGPDFERVFLFYKPSLDRLGIATTVRTVDEVQYQNRLRSWDFDIIVYAWGESLLPGNELRGFFGSQAADEAGSENVIGIKNPAVDAMIEKVVAAKTEQDLTAACHALDRILMWNNYVVPNWTYGKIRTARWNRFGRPQHMPKYGMAAFPSLWWWDEEKATKTGGRQ
jgi:microcin C transport system substrate-binding protein